VRSIDFEAHKLSTSTGELTYDYLILAPGGATNYFGIGSVERSGLGLKSIEEAVAIRDQVLRQFELGVQQAVPEVRRAMLTFVVVGGGPTGVEVAGMLSELIRLVLTKDFPELDFQSVRVILLEATGRLLAGFPERLSEATAEILARKYVEVRFRATVTSFDGENVELEGGEVVSAHTLIWAAGAKAAPLADHLGLRQGPLGRISVDATLRALGQERVFAIGDVAHVESEARPLPMMAPVAIQQGALAARNIERALRGEPLAPFVYRDPGSLATIGRNSAVARLGRFCFKGFLAWVLWLIVHLIQLIGFRNRLLVVINWAWDYFLYDRAVRLVGVRAPDREADSRGRGEQPNARRDPG
jgi:NADH dehydrogenase